MKTMWIGFAAFCCLCMGCSDSDKETASASNTCDAASFKPTCPTETSVTVCHLGRVEEVPCDSGNQCSDGECRIGPAACDASGYPKCDGDNQLTCVDGQPQSTPCKNGCEGGQCKPDSAACDASDYPKCDGDNQLTCVDGQPQSTPCKNGCEGGQCKSDPGACDASEYPKCEFFNLLTCNDGVLETKNCEFGCKNKACSDKPADLGPLLGVKECAFISLEKDETEESMVGKVRVRPVSDAVTEELVNGKLACGHREVPTYTWKTGTARHIECTGCAAGEYELIADLSLSGTSAGTYDCVFQVDINDENLPGGSGSTEYVNCPVEMGYPRDQKEPATDAIIRTYTVEGEAIDGVVLAHWDFAGLEKYDKRKSVKASDGIYSAKSDISLSDDGDMTMFTHGNDLLNMAASGTGWSMDAELSYDTAKYFKIVSSTTGYKNIRIQYTVAASGKNTTKHVATAVNAGGTILSVGDILTFDGRDFHDFPVSVVKDGKADDQTKVEFRIYPYGGADGYGNPATGMTARVDDIYIIGDAK